MSNLPSARLLAVFGLVFLVAGGGVFGYWASSGMPFVTQYKVEETVVEEDPFGDEIESTEWVEGFKFGLIPDTDENPVTGAAVLGGAPVGFAVVLFVLAGLKARADRRRQRRDDEE